MLLILTSEKDLTADFLIVELITRHLPYFRLNAEDLTRADFAFSLTENSVRREVSVGPRTLNLNEVEAVWYRRAIYPDSISALSPSERIFVMGEIRHLAMGLVLNPDVTWVNPIDRVSVAEHKLYQLQIARQLRFRVPRTVVSRDPLALRNFAAANEFGTICKPTERPWGRIFTFDISSRNSTKEEQFGARPPDPSQLQTTLTSYQMLTPSSRTS